jgi:tellurite resistance protein TehA-like permease
MTSLEGVACGRRHYWHSHACGKPRGDHGELFRDSEHLRRAPRSRRGSYSRSIAIVLWFLAAFGGAALLVDLLGHWIERGIKDFELTPALFIPVVGNATSVYAAVLLGLSEFAWASFAFAVLCWLTLGPQTMYRLLVVELRLPRKMAPPLAVLVSSATVLARAWYLLRGAADAER